MCALLGLCGAAPLRDSGSEQAAGRARAGGAEDAGATGEEPPEGTGGALAVVEARLASAWDSLTGLSRVMRAPARALAALRAIFLFSLLMMHGQLAPREPEAPPAPRTGRRVQTHERRTQRPGCVGAREAPARGRARESPAALPPAALPRRRGVGALQSRPRAPRATRPLVSDERSFYFTTKWGFEAPRLTGGARRAGQVRYTLGLHYAGLMLGGVAAAAPVRGAVAAAGRLGPHPFLRLCVFFSTLFVALVFAPPPPPPVLGGHAASLTPY